jgi:SAM-dependent methyltransferase
MVDVKRWQRAQKAESDHEAHQHSFTSRSHARAYFQHYWDSNIESLTDETVLAVGSGTGIIHKLENPSIQIGIDPLSNELDLRDSQASNIAGVGESLPFRSDQFDTVISFNVLDHTRDPCYVLNEISRVLKPDGRLLFGINTFDVPSPVRKQLGRFDPPHPHHFSTEEIHELLVDVGFEIEELQSDRRYSWTTALQQLREGQPRSSLRKFGATLAGIEWCTAVVRPSGDPDSM